MTTLALVPNVALAPRTTLGVGGPAQFFAEVATKAALLEALHVVKDQALELTVLGGGSNVVVSDRGVRGLVLRVAIAGLQFAPAADGFVEVTASAGENWDRFVAECVARDLAGVECLSGIPGDCGGTPIQNVGAYGQEVADSIVRVDTIDRHTGVSQTVDREACDFRYRYSRFKAEWREVRIVTAVTFKLRAGGAPSLRYGELTQRFGDLTPSLAETRAAILELRRAKSMVLDAEDENTRSAGSFFTNPIVSETQAEEVEQRARARGLAAQLKMPRFPSTEGIKLAAGWLIENAGFAKGTSFGRVGLSTRHALALVNRGGASALDVLNAALKIKRGVFEAFGVKLVPEPEWLGFSDDELAELRAR